MENRKDPQVESAMRLWWLAPLLSLSGCAQLLGIEETSGHADAAPADAVPFDASSCAGGNAHVTDPVSNACYVMFIGPATRDQGRASCKSLLGDKAELASVQSADENTLIANLIGTTTSFLGGTDEVTEGTFLWPDGSPVVFTNWNMGEPNNGPGFEEDCIVMLGNVFGKWDDRPCAPPPVGTGAYGYVCERD
jgi:hypothetical protein